jgi:hypothetical protein
MTRLGRLVAALPQFAERGEPHVHRVAELASDHYLADGMSRGSSRRRANVASPFTILRAS